MHSWSVPVQFLRLEGLASLTLVLNSKQSGAPIPVGDITHGQAIFDDLASRAGCLNSADSLNCLRELPFKQLYEAANAVPGLYMPRVDGTVIPLTPFEAIRQGKVARVPFVIGAAEAISLLAGN